MISCFGFGTMVGKVVSVEVSGIRLAGQLYLPDGSQPPYPTVCICHGIPAEAKDSSDTGYQLLAERVCREGLAVLVFNFRGTGASGGNFDMLGWTDDLRAMIDYLWTLPEVDKSRLLLLGFSGGAAVSAQVAAGDQRVAGVVTCACPAEFSFASEIAQAPAMIAHFRSIRIIRDRDYPADVVQWLDSFRRVRPVTCIAGVAPRPLLLVHGGQDDVVPVSHAHRLLAAAGEPKQLVIIEGAGHRLRLNEAAMATVIQWLKSHANSAV